MFGVRRLYGDRLVAIGDQDEEAVHVAGVDGLPAEEVGGGGGLLVEDELGRGPRHALAHEDVALRRRLDLVAFQSRHLHGTTAWSE